MSLIRFFVTNVYVSDKDANVRRFFVSGNGTSFNACAYSVSSRKGFLLNYIIIISTNMYKLKLK